MLVNIAYGLISDRLCASIRRVCWLGMRKPSYRSVSKAFFDEHKKKADTSAGSRLGSTEFCSIKFTFLKQGKSWCFQSHRLRWCADDSIFTFPKYGFRLLKAYSTGIIIRIIARNIYTRHVGQHSPDSHGVSYILSQFFMSFFPGFPASTLHTHHVWVILGWSPSRSRHLEAFLGRRQFFSLGA